MTETLTAGWYPDPADNSQMRYWDGSQWTGAAFPAAAMPAAGASAAPLASPPTQASTKTGNVAARTIVRVLLVIAAFSLLGFILLTQTIGTSKSSDLPLTIAAGGVVLPLVIALVVKLSAD